MQPDPTIRAHLVATGLTVILILAAIALAIALDADGGESAPASSRRSSTTLPATTSSSTTTSTTTTSTTTTLPPPPPPEPEPAVVEESGPQGPGIGSGPYSGWPSQGWFDELQACEGGGAHQWRTGYFGLEAGEPIGHLPYETQQAMVVDILNRYGIEAWGVLCRIPPY